MKEAARADLVQEVDAHIPDYIGLFRLLRSAGKSNAAKAKAIDDALEPVRRGMAMLLSPPPKEHPTMEEGL